MLEGSLAQGGARYRVAGFFRRLVALFADGVMLIPLVLLFGGATSIVAGQTLPRPGELGIGYLVHLAVDGGTAGAIALGMSGLVILLYEIIFVALSGQTPGQKLLGVRVVDQYGDSPGVVRAVVRTVAMLLSIALFGLGCLWIAFSREKRGLHDLLAGTWVVRSAPVARTAPAHSTPMPPMPPMMEAQ